MARILLISPPYLDLYGRLNKAAGRYFPLGLGYIAAYLRRYGGHDVRLYEPEAQRLSYPEIGNIIKEYCPDVIGLTSSTPNFTRALKLARIGRENSRAKIVLGGVHASALPEFIMETYHDIIDNVVIGEGEETMLELVKAYESGGDVESVAGIAYFKNGSALRTQVRPYIEELDSIPLPARDLIPQSLFFPNLHNARYEKCLSLLTSRGCPFNCSFCASRITSGRRYRFHSADYVLEEMALLKKDYGARQFLITDDTFTLSRERVEDICIGMIKRRFDIKWFCFSQVTSVDEDLLRLMKKAGCYAIGFGVESSDRDILREMGKPIDPEKALQVVHVANKLGFKTQAFYVFGMPSETFKQMKKTVLFAEKIDSTLAFFNMLVPYPGTRLFDFFFKSVPLKDIQWEDFVAIGEKCVLRNNAVPAKDIERLIADTNMKYYLKPHRILEQISHIRTFHELKGYISGGLSLLRQIFAWSR